MSSAVVEPSIVCFPNGNLRIDWTSVLGFPCINIFKPWSGCLEGYIDNGDSDEEDTVYVFDLPISLDESIANPDLQPWLSSIPQDLLNRCKALPSNQLFVLYCVSKSRDAKDLLVTNPLLLYLWLGYYHTYLQQHPEDIPLSLEHLRNKQLSILQTIAPRATKASLKLIKKIDIKSMRSRQQQQVLTILQRPEFVTRLAHQKNLTAKHFELADRYPWAIARPIASVLLDLSRSDHQILNDTINMSDGRAVTVLAAGRTWYDVLACHNRWAREWNYGRRFTATLLRDERGQALPFPPPPIESNDEISWLETPSEVVDEGRRMKHCVAAYAPRVQRGDYALYHMADPANLTVGLRKSVAGWQLDQVRGVCNRMPTREELKRIDEWLLQLVMA